jgi:hypothetical protein
MWTELLQLQTAGGRQQAAGRCMQRSGPAVPTCRVRAVCCLAGGLGGDLQAPQLYALVCGVLRHLCRVIKVENCAWDLQGGRVWRSAPITNASNTGKWRGSTHACPNSACCCYSRAHLGVIPLLLPTSHMLPSSPNIRHAPGAMPSSGAPGMTPMWPSGTRLRAQLPEPGTPRPRPQTAAAPAASRHRHSAGTHRSTDTVSLWPLLCHGQTGLLPWSNRAAAVEPTKHSRQCGPGGTSCCWMAARNWAAGDPARTCRSEHAALFSRWSAAAAICGAGCNAEAAPCTSLPCPASATGIAKVGDSALGYSTPRPPPAKGCMEEHHPHEVLWRHCLEHRQRHAGRHPEPGEQLRHRQQQLVRGARGLALGRSSFRLASRGLVSCFRAAAMRLPGSFLAH